MRKAINQLELSTAQEIAKWLLPTQTISEPAKLKAIVRDYLRKNKLTPYDAIEKIRKERSSQPRKNW